MCGIAGIIQSHPGLFSKEQLSKMTAALAHRGPDGEQYWQNESGHVLLGHRRLAVIDLSEAAAQPMHYLNRYSIIHNGEIYNYKELREELGKKGYTFQTRSDTEVILAAYDHWSEECTAHFDGMFAFAIWDEQEKMLFAARDRFGEKPFFYHFDGNNFLFASEMKALWSAGIERVPNLQMHFNFITIGYTGNPSRPEETFYNNIYKLPAASSLCYYLPEKELVTEFYWDIDPEEMNKKITDEEAAEQFSLLFSQSVSRRLRSDIAAGTSLSGGLDSSSVVAEINKERSGAWSQKAFTAIFPGFEKNESPFAKTIAGKYNLEHSTVTISAEDLLKDWDKLCQQQEEPFGSASIYAQYKVYELAAASNIKVLLDGQGADELLAGYHKYYKWYWQELFIKRKLISSGEIKAARQNNVKEKFGVKNIIASLFPDIASVVLERQYVLHALRHEDLEKDFVKLQSREAYYSTPAHYNLNGVLYFNARIHGLEELLRFADRNAMTHGVEVRLPFLQHELAKFIFSLPSHFKIRQGWTKWLLRKSMEQELPPDITWRKDKTGFEPPQQQWMQHSGLLELVHESKRKMVKLGILKQEVLNKPVVAKGSHEAGNYDWRYLSAAAFL